MQTGANGYCCHISGNHFCASWPGTQYPESGIAKCKKFLAPWNFAKLWGIRGQKSPLSSHHQTRPQLNQNLPLIAPSSSDSVSNFDLNPVWFTSIVWLIRNCIFVVLKTLQFIIMFILWKIFEIPEKMTNLAPASCNSILLWFTAMSQKSVSS